MSLALCLACLAAPTEAGPPINLCANAGMEEPGPAGWTAVGAGCRWSDSQAHSGRHALELSASRPARIGWRSAPRTLARPGSLAVSVWAKMTGVTGGQGVFVVLEHLNEKGERIGQSGVSTLGGAGQSTADAPWRQYFTLARVPPGVKSVRVGLWLRDARGTAWFDDVALVEYEPAPLKQARSVRRGLPLAGLAIVSCAGGEALAARIQAALKARGHEVPVIAADRVSLPSENRDLIVLGNLVTSKVAEQLYLNYYTYEDLNFPGAGGYVLRPLVDPLGTGGNMLVVGASDGKGLARGVDRLLALLAAAGPMVDPALTVETGEGYRGIRYFPWPAPGPYREMEPAGAYLKSGDLSHARRYREKILKEWFTHTDQSLADRQNALHLIYHSMTMSWDLMEACGVFSDAERLALANQLLKIMRSNQASGYSGISDGLFARRSRSNHDVRNARSFYFGWRYFDKYYGAALEPEVRRWQWQVENFFRLWHFANHRTGDSAISQHNFCGSMNAVVDVALMQPDWAGGFFQRGPAGTMGDWAIAVCNNMGQAVMLGDSNPSDYPSALFAKLAYRLADGRYRFMIQKRGEERSASDEPMRGFNTGVAPRVPADHVGLKVIPPDPLYFDSMLRHKAGVTLQQAFDKIALRSGFSPDDEYLLLEGEAGPSHAQYDANSIAEFSAHGRRWLVEPDVFMGPTMSFHNALSVTRDGLADTATPEAAELVARSSGPGYAYTATRLPRYNGAAWTRHLFWLPRRYTVVLDEVIAEQAGDYALVLGWRSLGRPELRPGLFTAAQDDRSPDGRNRFGLCFPAGLSASLDRDSEMLGAFVPDSPYHDRALNVLEQSQSRSLEAGETTCFQNAFWAAAGANPRRVELRRLNEHCALIRCGGEIALVGAGVAAASIDLEGLSVSGRAFYVSPDFECGDLSLAAMNGGAAKGDALRAVLQKAWERAPDAAPATADRWAGVARLSAAWKTPLEARPLALAAGRWEGQPRLAVGLQNGLVVQFDSAGRPGGRFRAGAEVHTLAAADLEADGSDELLVGSDDAQLYALDAQLSTLWTYKPPFVVDATTRAFCTMGRSKVRKIVAADIAGDRRPEVLIGAGNMRIHCLDAGGRELWRFPTAPGTAACILAADVYGDGKRRVLTGPTLTRPAGRCYVLDSDGRLVQTCIFGSYGPNLAALAVADLDRDGKRAIFCAGLLGNVTAFPADGTKGPLLHPAHAGHVLWERNLGRPVCSLTVVPGPRRDLLAVGSESGYLCAFDGRGDKIWGVSLASPVVRTALVRRARKAALLAAGAKNGLLLLVGAAGAPAACFDCRARIQDMIAADLQGDGTEEIVLATSEPDRLWVIAMR